MKGLVIDEGRTFIKTVGFRNLMELFYILWKWKVSSECEVTLHIQRGDRTNVQSTCEDVSV